MEQTKHKKSWGLRKNIQINYLIWFVDWQTSWLLMWATVLGQKKRNTEWNSPEKIGCKSSKISKQIESECYHTLEFGIFNQNRSQKKVNAPCLLSLWEQNTKNVFMCLLKKTHSSVLQRNSKNTGNLRLNFGHRMEKNLIHSKHSNCHSLKW